MKIGIPAEGFISWGGGVDFLATIIDSLLAAPRSVSERAEFHLLVPDPRSWRKRFFNPGARIQGSAIAAFSDRLRLSVINERPESLARRAVSLKLDALLPVCNLPTAAFPCGWVGYAYDFQHRYFPHFFTEKDLAQRDQHFLRMLTEAPAVVVNSRAVAADAQRFVPSLTARIFALPFAPAPQPAWKDAQPGVLEKYGVKAPFFLISNQFWLHKDHRTAFAAFRKIAETNADVSLICTGSTDDPRDPQYFPKLMEEIRGWGVEKRLRILGLIPKRDQIEIMKNAVAVVQPTLFEGGPGGGSVYDAVALGTHCLVSDLPVNRELDCGEISFFPVGNVDVLAEQMRQRLQTPFTRPDWDILYKLGRERRGACGKILWNAVETTAAA